MAVTFLLRFKRHVGGGVSLCAGAGWGRARGVECFCCATAFACDKNHARIGKYQIDILKREPLLFGFCIINFTYVLKFYHQKRIYHKIKFL